MLDTATIQGLTLDQINARIAENQSEIQALEDEISRRNEQQRLNDLTLANQLYQKWGITPAVEVESRGRKKRETNTLTPQRNLLPPKYRHPEDSTIVWSGKGPTPIWVKAHIEAGGSKEDLLINKQTASEASSN